MPDLNLFATFRFRSIECIIMRVLEHLHVHSSLASAVKVDSELNANSRTMPIQAGWQKAEHTTVHNLKNWNNGKDNESGRSWNCGEQGF